MDDGCWRANIDCLVVHKDYQQKGVGTTLLEQMMSTLRYVNIVNVYPSEDGLINLLGLVLNVPYGDVRILRRSAYRLI